eukprot:CAMPEP_0179455428 /NCGR_PEP_ID=MMETSP0799-20121207/39392_1 /TAXON_ID=46947 /ORGANISM="Geminigera cryophila, Strain CCMP2564" /LENGTH=213 /DNA_ID=CAMNT_0021254497 /DNA_START=343 /DNA_END=984 /DNA_ORIENTATION=+
MAKHRCQSNFESVISRFSCLFDLGSAAGRAGAVTALVGRGSGKLNNLHVGKVDVESLEHFLGLRIDIDGIGVKGRAVGHDIHAALTLLLLKLQRDAADGPPRNPFHQMRGEASNLVAKALGRDDGNILSDLLVGLEIMSQTGVVLLDENTCCLLDGLGANATLDWQDFVLQLLPNHNVALTLAEPRALRPSGQVGWSSCMFCCRTHYGRAQGS